LRAGNDGVFIVAQTDFQLEMIMSWKSWLRALRTPSKRTVVRKRRRLELEPLEDRVVPTAYVFVDFGDNFSIMGPDRVLTTTVGAIRDVAPDLRDGNNSRIPNTVIPGPQLTNAADVNYADTTSVRLTQFSNTSAARADMMAATRRAFASLDVTVIELTATAQFLPDGRIVAAAANIAGLATTLRGNFTNSKDVYVIVAQAAIGASNDDPRSFAKNGYGGIAPTGIIPLGIDLPEFTDLQGGFNRHDDLVLNFRNDAETIVHEAGHALGLRHSVTTPAPATSAINNAIHTSEVMSYLSGNTSYFFSRFPMVHGDDNTNPPPPILPGLPPGIPPLNNNDLAARGMLTPFDQLRIDPNVGENPNLHYISGTGAHDLITISRGFGNTAVVNVRAFTDNTYSTAIIVPGTNVTQFSYSFSLDRRILIQAGLGDDQITIDSGLNVPIDVDGMGGNDLILVAADANFVLANYRLDISGRPSINLENIEYAILSGGNGDNTFDLSNWTGTADLEGFGGRNTVVSSSDRNFILSDAVLHKISFDLEPIISINLSNIQHAVLTGRSTGIFPTSGNNSFDVSGWTGTATIDGAGGTRDLIISRNDANFVLTNFLLTRSTGGAFVLLNIESANLTGGAGSNTFDVGGWTPFDNGPDSGQVVLDGQGGFNTLVVANDVDFELTNSLLRRTRASGNQVSTFARIEFSRINHAVLTGGNNANSFTLVNWRNQATLNGNGGADRLILDDQRSSTSTIYSVTATRIDDRNNPVSGGITYINMPNLVINGGLTFNAFLVESTAPGSTTTINAGAGISQVVVTPTFHSLDQLQGTLTINGNGTVQLIVNDQNNPNTLITQDFLNSNRLWRLGRKFDPVTLQLVTHEALIYYGGLGSLVLNTGFLPNVVYVEGTSTPTTVNCGLGTQVVDVGVDVILGSLNLDKLGGALTVNGNGTVQLIVNDQLATAAETYSVTANLVSRTGAAPISYGNLASLAIYGGSGNDTVNVLSTAAGTTTLIDSGRGADVFQIGDNRRLSGINGPLHLQSATSFSGTDLFLDDSNELAPKTQVVLNDGLVTGLAPATISWTSSASGDGGITGVYILGGRGGNVYTAKNTSLLYHYTYLVPGAGSNRVFVQGNKGNLIISSVFGSTDTVSVGSQAPTLGGTLANVKGDIYVQGGGSTSLTVDDSGTTTDRTVTMTATDVKWQTPATIHWLPSVVKSVTLNWGSGNDYIFVNGTSAGVTTVVNGGDGNDGFGCWDLEAIRGPLVLHGEGGVYDYPLFYDYNNPDGQNYTLTTDQLRRAGKADITFDSMIQLILYTSLTGADVVKVESVAPGLFLPIALGIGDKITLGKPVAGGGRTLQDIRGVVRPQTYANGPVTVIVDDSADTESRDATFSFDTPNPAYLNMTLTGLAPVPIYFILDADSSLTVRGGRGDDTFRLPTALSPAQLTLNGGGGINTLDYSASTANVVVNLFARTATGLAKISRFQNATGGSGNDTLIGDVGKNTLIGNDGNDILLGLGGDDILWGGSGRDLLIGGLGADLLDGGSGDDILIGGYSLYDTQFTANGGIRHNLDLAALDAVMTEWNSAKMYKARTGALTDGVGPNARYRLDSSTVHDDGDSDTLTGGDGQDWFFLPKSGDMITDLDVNWSAFDAKDKREKTVKIK